VLNDRLKDLSDEHREALQWFLDREGEEVGWPEPLPSGLFLVNKAKGIHKPSGWDHALSVRQSLGGPYDDKEVVTRTDGTWLFEYFQEGSDPSKRDDDFTNRALMQNVADRVPVGAIVQVKKKPNPRYKVLGLAQVTGWAGGYFRLEGLNDERQFKAPREPSSTDQFAAFLDSSPADFTDARKRINAAIVARQGSGAFRKMALSAFGGRCVITGCDAEQALEAAHIVPYLGTATNQLANTLLLRADIHTLFDRGLITISDETLRVALSATLRSSSYADLEGVRLTLPPIDPTPWRSNLRQRREMLGY
jgi:putative restriction endonuclease